MKQPENTISIAIPEELLWENLKFRMILCLPKLWERMEGGIYDITDARTRKI